MYNHLKIAKKKKKKENEDQPSLSAAEYGGGLALGFGAHKGVHAVRGVGARRWMRDFMNNEQGTQRDIDEMIKTRPGVEIHQRSGDTPTLADHANYKKMVDWVRKKDPVKADAMEAEAARTNLGDMAGPHFMPERHAKKFGREKSYAYLGNKTRVGIAAHELGHAKDPSKIMKFNRDHLMAPSNMAQKVSPAAALAMATSKNKNVRRLGVATPWVAAAPLLAEEARANIHGWRSLNKLNLDKKTLRGARGDLLKSYGAYLALPAAASLGSYATGKFLQKRRDKKRKEKESGR